MVGKMKVRFIGAVWDAIDDFPLNEKVDIVVRPEDVILGAPGKGNVDGKITSKIFKGVHYEFIVHVGKNEVLCRDTKDHEVGSEVSISVEKENIQIMHKELTENQYTDAWIDNSNRVVIGEDPFACDVTKLVPGSHLDEQGYVIDEKNHKKYDFKDAEVVATIALDKVVISDDLEVGESNGTIINIVWIGDHYQYIIRTDDDEDFVVDSQYSWNENDLVSIHVEPGDIALRLKKDLDEYEVE